MLPGQMLPEQMLPRQLASVKDGRRNLPLKFGQNRISNRWDIPNMDKCCQDKYCMDKCQCDSWNLFKMARGTYLWNLNKIESVTAEITTSPVWWSGGGWVGGLWKLKIRLSQPQLNWSWSWVELRLSLAIKISNSSTLDILIFHLPSLFWKYIRQFQLKQFLCSLFNSPQNRLLKIAFNCILGWCRRWTSGVE